MSVTPTPNDARQPGAGRNPLGAAGAQVAFGWQLALSMILYTGLGFAADAWLDTSPWFLIAGALFGLIAMAVQVYRFVLEANQRSERNRARYRDLKAQPPPEADDWDADPWEEDEWNKDDWDKEQ